MDNRSLSYLTQRKVIGFLGIFLPLLSVLSSYPAHWFDGWWYSISITYYQSPIMAIVLGVVSLFLFTYKGYDMADKIINRVSAAAALAVVVFPCYPTFNDSPSTFVLIYEKVGIFQLEPYNSEVFHTIAASALFLSFALNLIINFAKCNSKVQKMYYRISGALIILLLIGIIVLNIYAPQYVIFDEFGILFLFGLAWLVKGKTFQNETSKSVTR